ncbi:MAG: hypothetical protein AB1726_11055 [Planctomycetota bacterium]
MQRSLVVFGTAFFLLAPAVLPAAPLAAIRSDLDYEAIAQHWLAGRGPAAAPGAPVDMERLLTERFASVRLGLFDVRVARAALADPVWGREIPRLLASLLDLQVRWREWIAPGAGVALEAEAKTLRSWLASWDPQSFAAREAPSGGPAIEAEAARESAGAAQDAFARAMRGEDPGRRPARLVLIPERRDFVAFTTVIGLADPRYRSAYWLPGIVEWTYLDYEGTRVVALQYAAPGATDFTAGLAMNDRNPKALAEHVVQMATRSLLDNVFGGRMEPMVAAGLANNMVIELFGEVDTRTDGDTRARQTEARSVFIPGGNPDGGALPPIRADSRWRESHGKDHFVAVLRRAQKAGARSATARRERHLGFELVADGGSARHVARAPFLGTGAGERLWPDSRFEGDALEFLRAYRSAFLFWLREHAAGDRKESHAAFAALLAGLAVPGAPALADTLAATYGVPLSEPVPGEGSLEGRFLLWLAKR